MHPFLRAIGWAYTAWRHATSKTVCSAVQTVAQYAQSSVSEMRNRAKTATEAHHDTIQLHLSFPSIYTVLQFELVSLRDWIYGAPVHLSG